MSHLNINLVANGGEVSAIVLQPNGGVVFGGRFTHVNGVARKGIARLNPSGMLDMKWAPAIDGVVNALAVSDDGVVYVGGRFGSVDGQPRENLVKLSAESGKVDESWTPSSDGEVYALAVNEDDVIYLGGVFNRVNDEERNRIAKLKGELGEVDPDWNPSANGAVLSLALDSSNNVYIGGHFTEVGGWWRRYLAKLSGGGIGAVDPHWNPSPDRSVLALALDGNEVLYVGGEFRHIGGHGRDRLAKVAAKDWGVVDPEWNPAPNNGVHALIADAAGSIYAGGKFTRIGGYDRRMMAKISASGLGVVDPYWNPGADRSVRSLAFDLTGGIYVGGEFTSIGDMSRSSFAKLEVSGAVTAVEANTQLPGLVNALAQQPDGGLIVGGWFTHAATVKRNNILRVSPDGSLDEHWNPSANNTIETIAVDATGAVYVGGFFTYIGGEARRHIAKLFADGEGNADPFWDPSADGLVRNLIVDPSGSLYAAGDFYSIGGKLRFAVAKLSGLGVGEADHYWNPSPNNSVNTLALGAGGKIYAGGSFTAIGGVSRRYIARLAADGVGLVDPDWNPAANSAVNGIVVGMHGDMYARGFFTNIGGQDRSYIAKISINGVVDLDWNPLLEAEDVNALAIGNDGSVYVGGVFSSVSGISRQNIAKLHPSGGVDLSWNPSADGVVSALHAGGDGELIYFGGGFRNIANLPFGGIAAVPASADVIFYNGFNDLIHSHLSAKIDIRERLLSAQSCDATVGHPSF